MSPDYALVPGSSTTATEGPALVAAEATRGIEGAPEPMVFVARALVENVVCRAVRLDQASFAPTALGAAVSFAMRRGAGKASAFVFGGLDTDHVDGIAYKLGLGSEGHVVLSKGSLSSGLVDEAPGGASGVLARSLRTFEVGEWAHLRLEWAVNTDRDTVVNAFANDLELHPARTPVWEPIGGIGRVFDDVAQIRTGGPPLRSGYLGFAFTLAGVGAWAAVTGAAATRQT